MSLAALGFGVRKMGNDKRAPVALTIMAAALLTRRYMGPSLRQRYTQCWIIFRYRCLTSLAP